MFQQKKENILSVYFTAGYPRLDDTGRVMQALEEVGVDMLEIGVPFSDPMADGPVIQESSQIALNNGATLPKIIDMAARNLRALLGEGEYVARVDLEAGYRA